MRQYERGLLYVLYNIGHGKCFPRAGHAQQGLSALSVLQAFRQLTDGLRLVARGLIWCMQLKWHNYVDFLIGKRISVFSGE